MTEQITIGIPRGMLFYRYEILWRSFFRELGIDVLVSEPTRQDTAQQGMAVTIDEACLALKLFFGHVDALIGKCTYILIARGSGYGRDRELCPRFAALYDMAQNVFRDQKFLPFSVEPQGRDAERAAFISLGQTLGIPAKTARAAYETAKREEQRKWKLRLQAQYASLRADGLKILIAAHSYVIRDDYTGKPILDFLKKNGAVPVRADVVDREIARRRSGELSPTCKWEMSREILGGIAQYRDRVDGIILLSTFPCGPDAMVNDVLLRKITDKPMLNLVLDGQNGTAGLETRLESFLDIIRFKKGLL